MVNFVEYVVAELKSKRLGKANALELMRQFMGRPAEATRLHPLMHRNVSTLTQQRYCTRLTGQEFFLRDHRVKMPAGAVVGVLPGVAYLEMARAAVADAVPELAGECLIAFENVLWLMPCVVESERDILIDIDAEEDFLQFSVFSEAASGNRTEHASGRIRLYDCPEAEPLDLARIGDAMHRTRWDSDSVYSAYSALGIEYGPAHRAIVRLDSGDDQVLAELVLPEALRGDDNAAYVLHPALMDSALQAAIGLGDRNALPSEPMLPFALESLCILAECPQKMYAFVRQSESAREDDCQVTLDLDICDERGNICVQMRGFCARRFDARSAAPVSAATDGIETLVATPEWGDLHPRERGRHAPEIGQVRVLLCGPDAVDPAALTSMIPGSEVERLDAAEADNPALRYEAVALQVLERIQDAMSKQAGATALLQCVIPRAAEGLLAGLGGMLRTATLESPSLSTQLLIVEGAATTGQVAADLSFAATKPHLSQIRFSGQGWQSLNWKLLPSSSAVHAAQPYKEDGVYVVTGGLGGLGGLFAREILAQAQGAHVVLTGRSPLDESIRERLDVHGFGSRLQYRQMDLDQPAQCRQVFEEIGRDVGSIRGVMHCAGTHSDSLILKKTQQDLAQVLGPKVRGTWNLDDATRALDLDFFVMFSSGVSMFGNVGQADYAAANGFMDMFATYREALVSQGLRGGKTLAINWPLWEEGGMRLDADGTQWLQSQTGMLPMRSASGIAVLRHALAGPHAQVLAVEGEGHRLRRLFDPALPPVRERLAVVVPARPAAQTANAGDLLSQARDFLRSEFSPLLKLAPSQIDIDEALENYGINSILAMSLTAQLEKHFGPLPKTLFFEYLTIATLSAYLVEAHGARLQALLVPASDSMAAQSDDRVEPAPGVQRQQIKPSVRGKSLVPANLVRRTQPGLPVKTESIAVIGLSGRYPASETLQDFWRNLRDGKDCVVEIPAERWPWEDYFTSDRSQAGHFSKWGGFVAGADEFDPQFFNISPREAPYIDPQERMFLQHAWMAVEDAGYTRAAFQQRRGGQVGVYAGVMYGEYNRSGSLASIANRVSYVLNLHGPSMTLDTMCSSSLTAIHIACQDLRLGRTDMALAGGVNLSVHPDKYSMLSAGQFISSAGQCASFGEGGDGYIPGEGVGVVVLKRLSDAERDGDAIHAVIRGSALNHGGKTNGYTVPNPQAQAAVIADALKDAGVDARHVSYIEAHGTGTKLGDPIEIAAISKAFREYTQDRQFCLIGSAKSNIGHCESAAGIAGLTKVILQMRHRQIVPSLHSQRLNPNTDFETTPFEVNQRLRPWEEPVIDGRKVPRLAGLSSFGAGGSNAHFVIEEYRNERQGSEAGAGTPAVVPISARTPEQLTQKVRELLAFLQEESDSGRQVDHAALAYTLQVGREAMDDRLAFVVDSTDRLQGAMQAFLDGKTEAGFRGQVKAHKEILGLFVADPDYEEVLDKWIAQRKLQKLAELWVKGLNLDWRKFHGKNGPRRVHLPTYPFAREKYWIDPIEGMFPRAGAAQPALVGTVHPLLHQNTSDLDQLRFSSVFKGPTASGSGPGSPAGGEYRLPSSVMLEMARAAIAHARHAASDTTAIALSDVRFAAPFIADDEKTLHIALYPSSSGGVDFDIYSGEGEELVHAQGSGDIASAGTAATVDLDAVASRMQESRWPTDDARSSWRLWRGEDELLIFIEDANLVESPHSMLPAGLAGSVFDGLATVLGLDGRLEPRDVASLDLLSACRSKMWIRVSWRAGQGSGFDMDWCGAHGEICLRWRGLVPASAAGLATPAVSAAEAITLTALPEVQALSKPHGIVLAEPEAMTVIAGIPLPKPDASRLTTLPWAAAPQPVVHLPRPDPVQATSAVAPQRADEAAMPRENVRDFLKNSLAQALYLDEAAIDDDRPFVDLGLDSIVGVEWVKSINKGLGIDIAATRVYDYANIVALTAFVESQLPAAAPAPAPAPAQAQAQAPVPVPSMAARPVATAAVIDAVRAADPSPADAPAAGRYSMASLQPELARSLAQALYLDEAAIDYDRSFVDLGLDSIVGVEWVRAINKAYGLEISATRVYDYASIEALARFLLDEFARLPDEQLPLPTATSAVAPPAAIVASAPAPAPALAAVPQRPSINLQAAAGLPTLSRRSRVAVPAGDVRATIAPKRNDERIAIVGMSGRYPDADNLDQFWRNLVQGRNSIREIPPERWDVDAYYDPTPGKPGKVYCKWLGMLDGAENFDPMFFHISPSEAEIMDPQHRLFMQESYRAFQDASYSSAALSNAKCGVYMGIMSSEYSFLLAKGNPENVETTGNSFAIGAARIAYHLNLKGPAIPIDTACSSSLVAIHLACQALVNHEIDMGLAGGVSLYLIPESYQGMCRAGMLSRDGQCKTFDDSADGFVPGEGVGTVVLKRLGDAERDGDHIHGVIIGSGINQDGKTNGITAPSVNSQIDLLRDTYRRYDIDPSSINYVETHGTGTKLGDPIELEALSTVFKESGGKKNFCALGAVKTNLGHTSGAAGVAGVHKVLLSLQHGKLAPNVNLKNENTMFDFAASPFYTSRTAHDWIAESGRKRRASVSAFGFSGTNAHVVIEEYVPAARPQAGAPQPMIVPLSARTAEQLHATARDLLAHLEASDAQPALGDLAYTLQIGRDHMRERCAWVVESLADLQARLQEFVLVPGALPGCHRGSVARSSDATLRTREAAERRLQDGSRQTGELAALWAEGADIDWNSFYSGTRPRRVSRLPSYPFAKERYWPQQAASVAAPKKPEAEIIVAKEQKRATCYVPDWQVAPLSSQRVPLAKGDTLLIVDSDDLLFEQVRARLHVASPLDAIVLVKLADAYSQDANDRFSVDASQPRHFEMLLEALRGQSRLPSHVIHNADAARLFQHGVAHQATHEAAEGAMRAGIDALSGLCRALAGAGAGQSPCAFVSCFHEDAAADSAGCQALAGFYRSLALENNRYQGRVLALDHQALDAATSVLDTVTCILDELQSPRLREVEVRYECSGKAAAHRLARVLAERRIESAGAGEPSLKQGGVYLITGGLGGLGYLFARHLAGRYRAKLILSGRSGLSGAGEEQLDLLRRLGADAIYVQADIADQSQVDDLIAGARARFGGLNGVIHSAGVSDDALLIRKDHEAFRKVLAPKVQGTLNLDRATASEPLDLFVMFSSGAGTFGNAGQSDYAYANAYMDAFAERRQSLCVRGERFGKTLSIGWPYWQEGGMQVSAADLQQIEVRTGLCALPTDTGIAYFEALLGSEPSRALALYGFPSRIDAHCRPPITAVATAPADVAAIDHEALPLLTHAYLCGLVHAETRIPVDRIDINERFEAFGFDSIMIGRFNAALEQDLGELPKTLMYEYETVAELAAYLCKAVAPALARRLMSDAVVAHPVANTSASTQASAASELEWPQEQPQEQPPHADAEPIAIIGVHASFPQSEDINALWGHLRSGNDLIQLVPESRWNHAEFYHPDPSEAENGKIYCKWGGFLENFDRFDAGFFNIPETEAAIIDPQERCFLQSAWAAVEDAGYTRERLKQLHPKGKSADVGVFVGVTTNSYQLLAPEAWQRGQMVTPSAMPWSIANRVSYCMDFQGPSLPVDTACSSSLVAVHLACESLRRRECAVALAGGVNLYLHPAKYQSFCQRRMLAEGEQCRSYGDGTDGFIPGEGVGTLVLKPLRLAERDGDHIHGVIRGSAFDHSGRSNGYATPNPKAQANVIAQALAQSGVPARSIGFIEGHGTGTRMGDSLEIAAITQAFSQHTTDTHFCALASLKANIGHAESATSIAGIAKILMQFKHRQIAPSIHAEVVNPDIDFANSPCILQTRLSSWEVPDGQPRRALINAFGAGGVNACAVLEEYVAAEPAIQASASGPCLFVVSAMSTDRLREYVGRHVGFLQANPGCDIEAVCFTMQVGREAMPERLALLVDSVAQLRDKLLMWLDAPANLPAAQLWQSTLESRTAIARTAREQHERVLALCESRDLSGLASLWVQGNRVEWQRLHEQRARLVAGLPVYPFVQQRHWVTDNAARSRPAAVQAGLSRLHPLVSHNSSTLERVRFDAVLDHEQYYAREHRLNGMAVFPGAGFVEMACVAATVAGQRRVREVRDIFWVTPLAVSESQQDLRISLLNAVADCTEFVVTTVDDDQETVVHCEGRAVFHDGTSRVPLRPSLPEWRQRCGEPHDGERYYGMFRRLGFDYGPAFRTIKEVSIGDGCALARLELDHAQSQDFDQYLLHPCLIDGALQTVVALVAAEEGGVPHLPFAIDAIEVLGSLTQRCHVLVEKSGGERDPRTGILQFNIHILSESGEPQVKITNFYVRALIAPAPATSSGAEDVQLASMAVSP